MILRRLQPQLRAAASDFRAVTLTGPRQSGKSILCRSTFPEMPFASLEDPTVREFALRDPQAFLDQFPDGAILDEVQRAPDLLSYAQGRLDASNRRGQFVFTGSQHFGLLASVSQSLAGRTAVLNLLPLGLDEVRRFEPRPNGLFETIVAGSYPEIHDRRVPTESWYSSYVTTYVERDIRQVVRVGDLGAFQTFVRLVAGRAGQLLNLASLGADAGITQPTARSWLSVLETGFLVFRLPPLHRNLGKRLTKNQKVYFFDTGLLCWLLGIHAARDLTHHPLRGAIFENWVVSEVMKARVHEGKTPALYFYRDRTGREIDLVLDTGTRFDMVEIKSGKTIASDYFESLDAVGEIIANSRSTDAPHVPVGRIVVYGGDESQARTGTRVLSWQDVATHPWT